MSRKRVPLNQNECTADFRIGVPFEQNLQVKSINRVLEPIKELLKEENMYPFLDVLDMDDMPTNSDVVLILSQYIKSMDIFHDKYYGYNSRSGQYEWSTK